MMRITLVMVTILCSALTGCLGHNLSDINTPTPPYGLQPLNLPDDEAPHDFQTEWWYFNAHLTGSTGGTYTLHDVLFQIQEVESRRTLYVRQIGLTSIAEKAYETSERMLTADMPIRTDSGNFAIKFRDGLVSGERGKHYRIVGSAGSWDYDLTMESTGPPLIHDNDGLVDFQDAGISYYYSRPRLSVKGTLIVGDRIERVTGLGWMDKQWGDFQPIAVGWDWASVQLHDGTDLMFSRLRNIQAKEVDLYATIRRPKAKVRRLGPTEFTFERSNSGSSTLNHALDSDNATWRIRIGTEGLDFELEPVFNTPKFQSSILGVAYSEVGVQARDATGRKIGQGFVEINRPSRVPPDRSSSLSSSPDLQTSQQSD